MLQGLRVQELRYNKLWLKCWAVEVRSLTTDKEVGGILYSAVAS